MEKKIIAMAWNNTHSKVGELAEELKTNKVITTEFDLKANKAYANELITCSIWLWVLSVGWGMVGFMATMIALTALSILEGVVAVAIALLLFALCVYFTVTAVKITYRVKLVRDDVMWLTKELARVTYEQNAYGVICHRS